MPFVRIVIAGAVPTVANHYATIQAKTREGLLELFVGAATETSHTTSEEEWRAGGGRPQIGVKVEVTKGSISNTEDPPPQVSTEY